MSGAVAQDASSIEVLVAKAAHLLPQQSPLHTFVHHNTLHAFEHLPFEAAVEEAADLWGTEPYQREQAFARHIASGRILPVDIDAVLDEELDDERAGVFVVPGLTLRHFRSVRLRHLFELPRASALDWLITETGALRNVHESVDASRRRVLQTYADRYFAHEPASKRLGCLLHQTWQAFERQAPASKVTHDAKGTRRRDQLRLVGGQDVDQEVHPLLIRLVSAFLDQGVSARRMPNRDAGLLAAVRALYGSGFTAPDPLLRAFGRELRKQERDQWDASRTVVEALVALGVDEEDYESVILSTLLSLRGWAGMVHQFEVRPDRAPVEAVPANLMEYLALQLTLDAVAAQQERSRLLGRSSTWKDLVDRLPVERTVRDLDVAYESFLMAQAAPVDPIQFLDEANAIGWMDHVCGFGEIARRRVLHNAYERRLRVTVLDGLLAHCQKGELPARRPRFQAVFCIDDRECSTRRHLEESCPDATTFGYAGFFEVAMAWQAIDERRPRPLCPVNLTPRHFVTERALRDDERIAWEATRRRRGQALQKLKAGSRTMALGGVLSAIYGLWSVVPMIGRCLFPRLAERVSAKWLRGIQAPMTRLVFERAGDEQDSDGRFLGYTVPEMVAVVETLLRAIALNDGFCDVVLIVGHGSASLNNPHGAAYNCGATGGGRGGANARVFAAMANHPGVRAGLLEHEIRVPEATVFVGGYHDTCDDDAVFYDVDLLPDTILPQVEEAMTALKAACQLEAHERCRRFKSAPRLDDAAVTLRHVQARSSDLAQPRPECGHATNAYAIVGRRSRTRGLFLDRRAFLCSYDPTVDEGGEILAGLLAAVTPVGAGINLEYYFSFVDPAGYGCGSKLPHNITGLVGVMDGHSSDLRTGLPWQMVEIHEPVRLLIIVEAKPELLQRLMDGAPGIRELVLNRWVQLVAWDPNSAGLWEFRGGRFAAYQPESSVLPQVESSAAFYRHTMDHLPCARVTGDASAQLIGGSPQADLTTSREGS